MVSKKESSKPNTTAKRKSSAAQAKGKCRDCEHYDADQSRCALMAKSNSELCLITLDGASDCLIGKFQAKGQAEELIGLRAFARWVGVSLASIQDAIDAGRITAVAKTPGGRKLKKLAAKAEWDLTRGPGNNNRWGELKSDAEDLTGGNAAVGTGGFVGVDPAIVAAIDGIDGDSDSDGLTPDLPWTLQKTKEEALLARQRRLKIELERKELEGTLHAEVDVEAVWTDMIARCRARLLAIPSKVAPIIAKMSKRDPGQVQSLIDAEIRVALTELSEHDETKIRDHRKRRTKAGGS
jgi:hypothetical protein